MMEFTDYQQQIRGVNRIRNTVINATMRLVCYDQVVYDDSRLEAAEYIGLALEVREFESSVVTIVEPGYENAAILILDDDGESLFIVPVIDFLLLLDLSVFRTYTVCLTGHFERRV